MGLFRLRLSVRRLMVLVLVLGGGLGWIIYRARVQRDAVAAIERSGGSVAYSWEWSNGRPTPGQPKPPGPEWLRRLLGPDFLDTVTYVRLQGPQCGDESLRAACRLPWLEELTVMNTSVTDAGAEDLRHLKCLRSLDYRLNRTTPRPLRHIAGMTELRELQLAMKLSPVPLKDDDMAFLRNLTKLRYLMLPAADLTDGTLVFMEHSSNLETLMLYDMNISTEGLRRLRGLSKLTSLSLHGSRITSFEHLEPLRNLTYLCVAYTPMKDAALAALPSWPELRQLDLRSTEVTDEGVAELMRARPRLTVTR